MKPFDSYPVAQRWLELHQASVCCVLVFATMPMRMLWTGRALTLDTPVSFYLTNEGQG